DLLAVARTDCGEKVAVVVEWEPRVEAAVEPDEVAAELEQLVDLREDVLAREDVAAGLIRQDVERAVVALRDADVRVVDDPHDHVGGGLRIVVPRAALLRATLELIVVRVQPQVPRLLDTPPPVRRAVAHSTSMNALTEKTARPGPASP